MHAVPVPVPVPPSVRSGPDVPPPQTFAVPPPAQVCGEVQLPHELTARFVPQLSLAVTLPQFLPSREQNALSLSAVHELPALPNIWSSAIWKVAVSPLFAVTRRRNCWYAVPCENE